MKNFTKGNLTCYTMEQNIILRLVETIIFWINSLQASVMVEMCTIMDNAHNGYQRIYFLMNQWETAEVSSLVL